ncbi:hypothetical protein HYX14_03245 [Candidatus Woesearchaeota archaeon]|nr:hypothetical protein [Candidatus Woesearchaeota archaeon]
MNLFLYCSKHFYPLLPPIITALEKQGHGITVPNSYNEPFKEEEMKKLGREEHLRWKSAMMRLQESKIRANDAILVCNFEKTTSPILSAERRSWKYSKPGNSGKRFSLLSDSRQYFQR